MSSQDNIKYDMNVTDAMAYCESANFNGIPNWTLPVIKELKSFLEDNRSTVLKNDDINYWTKQIWVDTTDPYYKRINKSLHLGGYEDETVCGTHIVYTVNSKTNKSEGNQCGDQNLTARCINHITFEKLPKEIKQEIQVQYNIYNKKQIEIEKRKKACIKENIRFQKSIKEGTICRNGDKVINVYGNKIKIATEDYNYGIVEKWIDISQCISPKISVRDMLDFYIFGNL